MKFLIFIFFIGSLNASVFSKTPKFEINYIRQKVDHFSYAKTQYFKQRYLVDKSNWNPERGPIFFYCGNEGSIDVFANNTGLLFDWAPDFNAMVVFAEHRYYGESLPFGEVLSKDLSRIGYLSVSQAMADYAVLIAHLKNTIAPNNSVVAFGGSYGGMLAAWMRMRYPHLVNAALASSAPILQFSGLTPCDAFAKRVTQDFEQISMECSQSIRRSWNMIREMAKADLGLQKLTKIFKLCDPLTEANLDLLMDFLADTWNYLAMVNYPYPTNFLKPLPAYPIKAACHFLTDSMRPPELLLSSLFQAASVFHNHTGDLKCTNITEGASLALGTDAWDFQSCTEMIEPVCSTGIMDMFEPAQWNITEYAIHCFDTWKVNPDIYKIMLLFGGRNISSSKIIFSNGLLDPWAPGGVLESLSDTLIAITIPDAAHHLDLRSPNEHDPSSVIEARKKEKKLISKWININVPGYDTC